jgi:hypothetical protein
MSISMFPASIGRLALNALSLVVWASFLSQVGLLVESRDNRRQMGGYH